MYSDSRVSTIVCRSTGMVIMQQRAKCLLRCSMMLNQQGGWRLVMRIGGRGEVLNENIVIYTMVFILYDFVSSSLCRFLILMLPLAVCNRREQRKSRIEGLWCCGSSSLIWSSIWMLARRESSQKHCLCNHARRFIKTFAMHMNCLDPTDCSS